MLLKLTAGISSINWFMKDSLLISELLGIIRPALTNFRNNTIPSKFNYKTNTFLCTFAF